MNVSPNILAKNWNFKTLRHGFVDERVLITTTLISSCHWKVLAAFCLPKKRLENAFSTNSELSQNRTEKQIMPSKTTINWLLNDMWCYLFLACFDWKVGVFQQTVVTVYYILKTIMYSLETISTLGPKYMTFYEQNKKIMSPTLLKKKKNVNALQLSMLFM